MPAVLATNFLSSDRYQLLADVDAGVVQTYLNEAEQDCDRMASAAEWGNRYLRAIQLLAAHRLTVWLNQQSGVAIAGAVSNINVSNGSQSIGFGGGGSSPDDPEGFQTTVYGREFWMMRKQMPFIGFSI